MFQVRIGAPHDDEEWFRFGPTFMSRAEGLELPSLDGIVLHRDKPVSIPVCCIGATAIELVLGEKSRGGFSGSTIDCDPMQIEVERAAGQQLFHVKVDRAAIDAVLEQREEREK